MSEVSAIVSAYYAEKFLKGRLENLLQQTKRPEILVVCTKNSVEEKIAKAFTDPEVRVIVTDGIPGIYEAWNIGIRAASSDFLTNANSDDRLRPNALEIMAATLRKMKKFAVVYGNQEIVEKLDGNPIGIFEWAEGGLDELLKGCFLGPMPMWRKSLHTKYGYFDESFKVAGDYEFWLRLAAKGEMFYHINAPVGTYLQRKDSAEHRESMRALWETARARAMHRKEE